MDVGTDAYSLNYRGLYSDLYVNLLSHKRVYKRPKKRVTMSELEQNLSNNALMLVVEMLAAKELYDSTRTTEDFEFLCEKRKALESYIAELEAENDQLTAHDATERQDDSNDTQTQTVVYGKESEG